MISVVLQCFKRLKTTKKVLRAFVDKMRFDYEIVLMYDGDDKDYIRELRGVYPFEKIVKNEGRRKTMGRLYNEAYLACAGEYFSHLENDRLWVGGRPFEIGLKAIEQLGMDCIDLRQIRGSIGIYKRFHEVDGYKVGVYKRRGKGGPHYHWSFGPNLRKWRFPNSMVPENVKYQVGLENTCNDLWNRKERTSGCFVDLKEPTFVHLGNKEKSSRYLEGNRYGG